MDCSDNSLGPTVPPGCRGGFDFTLGFEDVVLAVIPSALGMLLGATRLWYVRARRPKVRLRVQFTPKAAIVSLLALLQIALLVLWGLQYRRPSTTSLPAAAVELTATLVMAFVSYAEHMKTLRPSTLLSLYLLLAVLFDIARARTLWLLRLDLPLAPVFTACVAARAAWLVLEAWQKRRLLLETYCEATEEEMAGILSRSVFGWLLPMVVSASRKDIGPADLLRLDAELQTSRVYMAFEQRWRRCPDRKKPHALVRCLFASFKWQLLLAVLPRLGLLAFTVLQPIVIERLVEYVGDTDLPNEKAVGLGLIGAVALVYGGTALCTALYYHAMYRFVTMVRGALITATYQAALASRLSSGENSSPTLTLISADVDTTVTGLLETHELWASFTQIGLVMWLLSRQVQWAAAAPLVLSLGCILTSLLLFSRLGQNQKQWNESIQVRLGATADMLAHMREIKFLGLTGFFTEFIQGMRANELQVSQQLRSLLVGIVVISRVPMTLAPIITFIIYAVPSNGSFLPAKAFSSLTMIGLVSDPINLLVQAAPGFAGSLGCLDRIQKFLTSGEQPLSALPAIQSSETLTLKKDSDLALDMSCVSFGWEADRPVLSNLSVNVPRGSSVAITGPVACGKTSLLKGILGETSWSSGKVDIHAGSVGYCDQNPWMLNATVQQNIYGESVPDLARYKRVLVACDLEEDLAALPEGEKTMVGSNAIKLSQGQKQRICLARTLMQRADLVLLDDVLSGLDEHTKTRVSSRVFGPQGLLKQDGTAFLVVVTDNRLLPLFDHCVSLTAQGTIARQGPANTLESEMISQQHREEQASDSKTASHAVEEQSDGDASGGRRDSILDEPPQSSRRAGDLALYGLYATAAGRVNTTVYLAFVAALAVLYNFSSVWLNWWSSANANGASDSDSLAVRLSVYAVIGILTLVFMGLGSWQLIVQMVTRSALYFHSVVLQATMGAPLYFFARTDIGVLMNHFSEDMQLFDMGLPIAALNTSAFAAISLGQLIVIAVSARWIAATIPALLAVIYLIQRLYLRTSRQVRLLDIELRAPLYRQFLESIQGLVTIRCFGWQESFATKQQALLDDSQRAIYMLYCIQRWLTLVLDLLVAGTAVLLAVFAVTLKHSMSAGAVGLAISNITTFSYNLATVIEAWTKVETSLGALVRTRNLMKQTPVELGASQPASLQPEWPQKGEVRIEELVASYGPSSPVTLKKISMVIEAGQRVGICGRTGSGKSSLIFSLYRGMNIHSGRILIDGIDLATVPPEEIRSRMSTVTQDPLLVRGSVRFNLDFRATGTDTQLLAACKRVGLEEYILDHGGLDAEISSLALSPGQKQLFCLARVLLHPKQILILDEVTSKVDAETDLRMREIIDQEFRGCTVIAIAHRLGFISNYDRVAVLDHGEVVEWGSPQALLAQSTSRFAGLHASTGDT